MEEICGGVLSDGSGTSGGERSCRLGWREGRSSREGGGIERGGGTSDDALQSCIKVTTSRTFAPPPTPPGPARPPHPPPTPQAGTGDESKSVFCWFARHSTVWEGYYCRRTTRCRGKYILSNCEHDSEERKEVDQFAGG